MELLDSCDFFNEILMVGVLVFQSLPCFYIRLSFDDIPNYGALALQYNIFEGMELCHNVEARHFVQMGR